MHETEFEADFSGAQLGWFRRRLLRWYEADGRALPWRESRDAYRVWISEIMLQQTTVAAVVPYFERFLDRFPTVGDVAEADEQDVLRLWEGLGYYSRARNIHKAARMIVAERGGRFPRDVVALQALPGIGRYTAGAIASFAFDEPAAIVEANTLRLYCRLLGYEGDPRSTRGQKLLWAFAGRLVPDNSPGRFNQALMDLGAQICQVAQPACEECPVATHCRAFAVGSTHEIPPPAKRPEVESITEAAVVVRKNGRVLLRRCQPGERWAGLWDFPRFGVTNGVSRLQHVRDRLREMTGVIADIDTEPDELRHSVTRFQIRLLCYRGRHAAGPLKRNAHLKWVPLAALGEYPLSVTGRRIASGF
ncbi:MAG: A/G-specific adenine glycosylase [Planctomycetaceae bacterium]